MERKIGEKFEYAPGVWLEVVAGNGDGCFSCALLAEACGTRRDKRGNCSRFTRRDHPHVIFTRCEPPAPEADPPSVARLVVNETGTRLEVQPPAPEKEPIEVQTTGVAEATLEFTATGTVIQDAPPPSEWFKGLSDAWGAEILEAARDAFVYRFWDYPNTALALVMGVSEATVRRIRKKRLRKNKTEL